MDIEKKPNDTAASQQQERSEHRAADDGTMRLDDSQRVKVLSPGMLVFKRFMRNKLAIAGVCILVAMFLFSFICPLFYEYGQTQVFYKYDYINANYAGVTVRQDVVNYTVNADVAVADNAKLMINSDINKLDSQGGDALTVEYDGNLYILEKLGDYVYTTSAVAYQDVAVYRPAYTLGTYNTMTGAITYNAGVDAMAEDFVTAVAGAVNAGKTSVTYKGLDYSLTAGKKFQYTVTCTTPSLNYNSQDLGDDFEDILMTAIEAKDATLTYADTEYLLRADADGSYSVSLVSGQELAMVSSVLVFDTDTGVTISDDLRVNALLNVYSGEAFTVDGQTYTVEHGADGDITLLSGGEEVAYLTNFAIRDTLGNDTLSLEFKEAVADTVRQMNEGQKVDQKTFTFLLQKQEITTNEAGQNVTTAVLDENGDPIMEQTTLTVTRKTGQYEVSCPQLRYLIDISSAPTAQHWLGTDANGMDNLARMMYGGRISMMVGFIVVFLETVLGVIMGGIAGYFGGWVDTLIMRLVDIFRCIPSMPILIILAAFMDAQQVGSYVRLMYMMAVLGFLGWAGVARLVRGQILSLREQEFMTATEATGIRVSRRIFQHLVPNVMPQLIVTATSGLGSVILTESTLSFLGLGVKFPMATWGNIINTVTKTNENLLRYTYIWIPVGLLICLTVIAFNFVGDGLRDAFDPKMKR